MGLTMAKDGREPVNMNKWDRIDFVWLYEIECEMRMGQKKKYFFNSLQNN